MYISVQRAEISTLVLHGRPPPVMTRHHRSSWFHLMPTWPPPVIVPQQRRSEIVLHRSKSDTNTNVHFLDCLIRVPYRDFSTASAICRRRKAEIFQTSRIFVLDLLAFDPLDGPAEFHFILYVQGKPNGDASWNLSFEAQSATFVDQSSFIYWQSPELKCFFGSSQENQHDCRFMP
ncbi:hypothetical protein NE237_029012 [Protea cynaroides]|uniref:Uncharacterized protein n=1 Tax=Protea cynaroides TaxID=273540 RepID=A0A9Q0GTI7_9MAGN|nr:hypothetical protein NE237_029012 [Protea cynaroides]